MSIVYFVLAVLGLAVFALVVFATATSLMDVEEECGDPFWGGKQWSDEEIESLKFGHKKPLVFNKIEPKKEPDEHEQNFV